MQWVHAALSAFPSELGPEIASVPWLFFSGLLIALW
jgi:hypothetical protein